MGCNLYFISINTLEVVSEFCGLGVLPLTGDDRYHSILVFKCFNFKSDLKQAFFGPIRRDAQFPVNAFLQLPLVIYFFINNIMNLYVVFFIFQETGKDKHGLTSDRYEAVQALQLKGQISEGKYQPTVAFKGLENIFK